MKNLNFKAKVIITIIIAAVFVANLMTKNIMLVNYALLIIWALSVSGILNDTKTEKIYEEPENEVLSDDEMEEFILEEGEFSYENYDEVCCPKCGEFLGNANTKCPTCGYSKEDIQQFCENCGKLREDKIDFCPYCNTNYPN